MKNNALIERTNIRRKMYNIFLNYKATVRY